MKINHAIILIIIALFVGFGIGWYSNRIYIQYQIQSAFQKTMDEFFDLKKGDDPVSKSKYGPSMTKDSSSHAASNDGTGKPEPEIDLDAKHTKENHVPKDPETNKMTQESLQQIDEKKALIEINQEMLTQADIQHIYSLTLDDAKQFVSDLIKSMVTWTAFPSESTNNMVKKGSQRCKVQSANTINAVFRGSLEVIRGGFENIPSLRLISESPFKPNGKVSLQLDESNPIDVNYISSIPTSIEINLTKQLYLNILNSKTLIIHTEMDGDGLVPGGKYAFIHYLGNLDSCMTTLPSPKRQNWLFSEDVDAFDNKTRRFCMSTTQDKVNSSFGFHTETPNLLIRQYNQKTPEIMLTSNNIHFAWHYDHRIRVKFDDETPFSISYSEADGSSPTIFLNSVNTLLQKFYTANQVTFEVPLSSGSRARITYDLVDYNENCSGFVLPNIKKPKPLSKNMISKPSSTNTPPISSGRSTSNRPKSPKLRASDLF